MVQIDSNKPLPEHTKLDYDECLAKLYLEIMFPERYSTLQIGDKPDLCDFYNHIGIEVTSSIPTPLREAIRLRYTIPYEDDNKAQKHKERMAQLGIEYTDGFQVWPSISYPVGNFDKSPFVNVVASFKTKIDKLNRGEYKTFDRYDLYIYTELHLYDDLKEILLKRLIEANKGDLTYTYVYVVGIKGIYAFDLENNKMETREFPDNASKISIAAREMIERAELNEQT